MRERARAVHSPQDHDPFRVRNRKPREGDGASHHTGSRGESDSEGEREHDRPRETGHTTKAAHSRPVDGYAHHDRGPRLARPSLLRPFTCASATYIADFSIIGLMTCSA